jgi:hypothetical protein
VTGWPGRLSKGKVGAGSLPVLDGQFSPHCGPEAGNHSGVAQSAERPPVKRKVFSSSLNSGAAASLVREHRPGDAVPWSCRAVRSAHLPVKEEIAGSNPVGTAEGRLYRAVVKNLLRTRRQGTFPQFGRLAQRESATSTR